MGTGDVIDQGKRNVLGVLVDADRLRRGDRRGRSPPPATAGRFALTALAVHGVMTGVQDRAHGARLNAFDLVTPDGQPVRWALNSLHHAGLADRVYGPTLTLRVLERAADEGLPVYLYGSTDATLDRLVPHAAASMFPALKIAGREPSKFRAAAARRGRRDRRPDHRLRGPDRAGRAGLPTAGDLRLRDAPAAGRCRCSRSARPSTTTPGCCASRRRGCSGAGWSGCGGWAWSRAGCGGATSCSTRPTWPGSRRRSRACGGRARRRPADRRGWTPFAV